MPIFEYYCPKHGIIEILSDLDSSSIKCPQCKEKCYKIVSLPSKPIFKGTGFYETDYKNKH